MAMPEGLASLPDHLLERILGFCAPLELTNALHRGQAFVASQGTTTAAAVCGVSRAFRRAALAMPWTAYIYSWTVARGGCSSSEEGAAAWASRRRLHRLVLQAAFASHRQRAVCATLLRCAASTLQDLTIDCWSPEIAGMVFAKCPQLQRLSLRVVDEGVHGPHWQLPGRGQRYGPLESTLPGLTGLRVLILYVKDWAEDRSGGLGSGMAGALSLAWLPRLPHLTALLLHDNITPPHGGVSTALFGLDHRGLSSAIFDRDLPGHVTGLRLHSWCLRTVMEGLCPAADGAGWQRPPPLSETVRALMLIDCDLWGPAMEDTCMALPRLERISLDSATMERLDSFSLPPRTTRLMLGLSGSKRDLPGLAPSICGHGALVELVVNLYVADCTEGATAWAVALARGMSGVPTLKDVLIWLALGKAHAVLIRELSACFDKLHELLLQRGGRCVVEWGWANGQGTAGT